MPREVVSTPDIEARRKLAMRPDLQPEILSHLAADVEDEVRQAVAQNPSTPPAANLMLANDRDPAVRSDLAQKIAHLLPQVSKDRQDLIYGVAIEILEKLARDQVVRVRRVIAETLKDMADAPQGVVRLLAADSDPSVAGPLLRFSPVLTDQDLIGIILSEPVQDALLAISGRAHVGDTVSAAIVGTSNQEAITALLVNPTARIREDTLDLIIDRAPTVSAWHGPLVRREGLTAAAVERIAAFVADELLDEMVQRGDLDHRTRAKIGQEVSRRLSTEIAPAMDLSTREDSNLPPPTVLEAMESGVLSRVTTLAAQGDLTADLVIDELAKGNRRFVASALAILAGIDPSTVHLVASLHSAKGIVAIAWKAGFPPSAILRLQLDFAGISPDRLLHPPDRTRYPMTEEEMNWQLEVLVGA